MSGDLSISLVSTYPPTRCGVARFAQSLVNAWADTSPEVVVEVARVAGADDPGHPIPGVAIQFDPASSIAVRTAAGQVNRSDVALIQHEYGVYGPDEGAAILDLVDQIRVPVTTVLHTVLPSPTDTQRRIASGLADAGPIVASTETARYVASRQVWARRVRNPSHPAWVVVAPSAARRLADPAATSSFGVFWVRARESSDFFDRWR